MSAWRLGLAKRVMVQAITSDAYRNPREILVRKPA